MELRRTRSVCCLGSSLLLVVLVLLSQQGADAHCNYAKINSTYMEQLCSTRPTSDAPACTIFNLCNNATVSPPLASTVCNTSVLATQLCLDDAAVVGNVTYCTGYIKHTNESLAAENETMTDCWAQLGVDKAYSIPKTSVVRQAAFSNCAAMGSDTVMPGCSTCVNNTAAGCPDPFEKLAIGCIDMNMTGCAIGGWRSWCSKEATSTDQQGNSGPGIGAGVLCLPPAQRVTPAQTGFIAVPSPATSSPAPVPGSNPNSNSPAPVSGLLRNSSSPSPSGADLSQPETVLSLIACAAAVLLWL